MRHLMEQHHSPDGLQTLKIGREDDGSVTLGFQGCSWHTHADILAALSGLGEEAAVRQYVDALLAGRAVIAVTRAGGVIRDARMTDEPEPRRCLAVDETMEFRYWDGSPV